MAKKKTYKKQAAKKTGKATPKKTAHKPNTKVVKEKQGYKFWLPAIVAVVITFAAFYPSLQNEFTNWDDEKYIVKNDLITVFTPDRMGYFFKNYYFGNYHPFTMVSYMWEYSKVQLEPYLYHRNNLILHLLNVLLVYLLLFKLSKRKDVAIIVAVLFGVHPMHVQSVAWVAERKDVLYTFFYLGGLIAYLNYLKNDKRKLLYISLAFVLFVCSLLSKAAAVMLPVTFVLIDYLQKRKINIKTLLEKAPFFALSAIFGYVAIKAQESTDSIASFDTFSIAERFMFVCYGICTYIGKLFVPVNLSCFHPYPNLTPSGGLPTLFYICPLIVLALAGAIYYSAKKTRIVVFGSLFFLANIFLVLQWISVGNALYAERYTYVPYIGLFFIIAMGVSKLKERYKQYYTPTLAALGVVVLVFSYFTYQRTQVWKNSETLWTDFIEKYPLQGKGYESRGNYYAENQRFDEAFADFTKAIQFNPQEVYRTYGSRGNIYAMRGQLDLAMADYNMALQIDPQYEEGYFNRAVTLSINKRYAEALQDYNKAAELDPNNMKVFISRAYTQLELGRPNKSIEDCNYVLSIKPNSDDAYLYRGMAYHKQGNREQAIADFNAALQINPQNVSALYNRGVVRYEKGEFKLALQDITASQKLGKQVPVNFLNKLKQQAGAK